MGSSGKSMKIYSILPHRSDEAYGQQYMQEAFKTNWIAPKGLNVDNFVGSFFTKLNSVLKAQYYPGRWRISCSLEERGEDKDLDLIEKGGFIYLHERLVPLGQNE